jgi:hypothetical protein
VRGHFIFVLRFRYRILVRPIWLHYKETFLFSFKYAVPCVMVRIHALTHAGGRADAWPQAIVSSGPYYKSRWFCSGTYIKDNILLGSYISDGYTKPTTNELATGSIVATGHYYSCIFSSSRCFIRFVAEAEYFPPSRYMYSEVQCKPGTTWNSVFRLFVRIEILISEKSRFSWNFINSNLNSSAVLFRVETW